MDLHVCCSGTSMLDVHRGPYIALTEHVQCLLPWNSQIKQVEKSMYIRTYLSAKWESQERTLL